MRTAFISLIIAAAIPAPGHAAQPLCWVRPDIVPPSGVSSRPFIRPDIVPPSKVPAAGKWVRPDIVPPSGVHCTCSGTPATAQ